MVRSNDAENKMPSAVNGIGHCYQSWRGAQRKWCVQLSREQGKLYDWNLLSILYNVFVDAEKSLEAAVAGFHVQLCLQLGAAVEFSVLPKDRRKTVDKQ